MNSPKKLSRQGHRLIQIGIALVLFLSFEGFVIPYFAVPRLGLSVHTLSSFEGLILIALGLIWPRLHLGPTASRVAFWCFVYSAFATLVPYILAAVWGAGGTTIQLAAGAARGSALQEGIIEVVLYSAAPTVIISLALILWGLRGTDSEAQQS